MVARVSKRRFLQFHGATTFLRKNVNTACKQVAKRDQLWTSFGIFRDCGPGRPSGSWCREPHQSLKLISPMAKGRLDEVHRGETPGRDLSIPLRDASSKHVRPLTRRKCKDGRTKRVIDDALDMRVRILKPVTDCRMRHEHHHAADDALGTSQVRRRPCPAFGHFL